MVMLEKQVQLLYSLGNGCVHGELERWLMYSSSGFCMTCTHVHGSIGWWV